MSKLLGDTAVAAAQTSVKWQRAVGPVRNHSRTYCLRPAVPPEKKWLYKQVLDSVQSGMAPQFNLANSTLGRATTKVWTHLNIAHERALDMADEYHLKERLMAAIQQVSEALYAVKNFVVLRQYYHLDGLIDRGLLALESKIRATRENIMLHETSPTSAEKVSIKNCTMIMLKRDPCVGVEYRADGIPKITATLALDKSQRSSSP